MHRMIGLLALFALGCGNVSRTPTNNPPTEAPILNPDIKRAKVITMPDGMKLTIWTKDGRKFDRCVYPIKERGSRVSVEGGYQGAKGKIEWERRRDYGTTPEGQDQLAREFQKCKDDILGGDPRRALMEDTKREFNDFRQKTEREFNDFRQKTERELNGLNQAIAWDASPSYVRIKSLRAEPSRVEPSRVAPSGVEPSRVEPPELDLLAAVTPPVARVGPPPVEPSHVEPSRVEQETWSTKETLTIDNADGSWVKRITTENSDKSREETIIEYAED